MGELARNMGTAVENMTKMMTLMKEEADARTKSQEDMMKKMMDKMVEKKKDKEQKDVTTLKAFSDLP